MIVSGRCHGPGCRKDAVIEDGFCGWLCQQRWHERHAPALREAVPDPGPYGLFQHGLPADVPPFQPRDYPQFLGPTGQLQQVASPSPQVTHTGQRGWLGRWLHRIRRTR